jgi:hypothetical protein
MALEKTGMAFENLCYGPRKKTGMALEKSGKALGKKQVWPSRNQVWPSGKNRYGLREFMVWPLRIYGMGLEKNR